MEILGVGPLELFFIFFIALIVLGPKDMIKAGKTLGRFMRKIVTSPTWHTIQRTSRELKSMPNKLIRDAGLEDINSQFSELNQIKNDLSILDPTSIEKVDETNGLVDYSEWFTPPQFKMQNDPIDLTTQDTSSSQSKEEIPLKPAHETD